MRVSLHPPPTIFEHLLGRKRAKSLRRSLGIVALAAGVSLLKPRLRSAHVVVAVAVVTATSVGLGVLFA
jgi:hypothetical protein